MAYIYSQIGFIYSPYDDTFYGCGKSKSAKATSSTAMLTPLGVNVLLLVSRSVKLVIPYLWEYCRHLM